MTQWDEIQSYAQLEENKERPKWHKARAFIKVCCNKKGKTFFLDVIIFAERWLAAVCKVSQSLLDKREIRRTFSGLLRRYLLDKTIWNCLSWNLTGQVLWNSLWHSLVLFWQNLNLLALGKRTSFLVLVLHTVKPTMHYIHIFPGW